MSRQSEPSSVNGQAAKCCRPERRLKMRKKDHAPAAGRAFEPTKKKTVSKSQKAAKRRHIRDARLPAVGTVLTREIDGKSVRATVAPDGFVYGGKTYRSLSAVAKEATGTIWNGFLFFRLMKPAARMKAPKRGAKS